MPSRTERGVSGLRDISVRELASAVDDFIRKRNWKKYHNPKDIAIALSVEASELLEIFLWKDPRKGLSKAELENVRMEAADVSIYALSLANACGFDLGEAIQEKISLNEKKYPVETSRNKFD